MCAGGRIADDVTKEAVSRRSRRDGIAALLLESHGFHDPVDLRLQLRRHIEVNRELNLEQLALVGGCEEAGRAVLFDNPSHPWALEQSEVSPLLPAVRRDFSA